MNLFLYPSGGKMASSLSSFINLEFTIFHKKVEMEQNLIPTRTRQYSLLSIQLCIQSSVILVNTAKHTEKDPQIFCDNFCQRQVTKMILLIFIATTFQK